MILIDAINAIDPNAKIADTDEQNQEMDNLTLGDYPVHMILPLVYNDSIEPSGLIKSSVTYQAFFLDRGEENTTEYSTNELERQLIAPMRERARKFLKSLHQSEIIDREADTPIEGINITATYLEYDACVHGVYVTATLYIVEDQVPCQYP